MKNGRNPSVSTKNPGNMAAWVLITGARTRRRIAIIAGPVWRGVGLRTRSMVRRRGGLHGRPGRLLILTAPPPNAVGAAISRPGRLAISTAAPPNVVGRHAHMPPWLYCDDRGPWWLRGVRSGRIYNAPLQRKPGTACVCRGGLNIRPDRAAMTGGPWWFRRPARAGCGHPALRTKSMVHRRGGYQPPEQARDSRRTSAEPCRAVCPHAAMAMLR